MFYGRRAWWALALTLATTLVWLTMARYSIGGVVNFIDHHASHWIVARVREVLAVQTAPGLRVQLRCRHHGGATDHRVGRPTGESMASVAAVGQLLRRRRGGRLLDALAGRPDAAVPVLRRHPVDDLNHANGSWFLLPRDDVDGHWLRAHLVRPGARPTLVVGGAVPVEGSAADRRPRLSLPIYLWHMPFLYLYNHFTVLQTLSPMGHWWALMAMTSVPIMVIKLVLVLPRREADDPRGRRPRVVGAWLRVRQMTSGSFPLELAGSRWSSTRTWFNRWLTSTDPVRVLRRQVHVGRATLVV